MSTAPPLENNYDLIIVGAGPAGITAGIYGARALLKTIVLDSGPPGGQLLRVYVVDDYPGFKSIPGTELAERMADHARSFGATFASVTVERIVPDQGRFIVRTSDGSEYRCGAVIMATGGRPRKLGVPGEDEFFGRGVSYCAICDGPFFRDKTVALAGGGDSAAEEAIYLTRFAERVNIISRGPKLTAAPQWQQRVAENPKITVHYNRSVEAIGGGKTVEWLRLRDTQSGAENRLPAQGIFIYIGFEAQLEALPNGVRTDENGLVVTKANMETDVPGLFVSGDIHSHPVRHITAAVADATVAAISAYRYLREAEESGRWKIIGISLPPVP
jgi:thioredoxin reductase (NADPH)